MAASTGAAYDDLATAFRHGNFKPLYFFYGDEGFLMDELQALLVEHALRPEERAFNLDIVHGPEARAQAVLAQCASYPMMAERRVVVVRGFEQLEENRLFQGYAERPNPTAVVLLLCYGKPNLTQHPYRALKQHAVWAEFKPLYERQIPGWIAQRLKAKGAAVEGGAAQMLAEAVGTNLRAAAMEVDKLAAYVGDRKAVTEDDVVHAAGRSREANVFELQKAVGLGEHARALAIVEALLAQASNRRGEALLVVSVLSGFLVKLWKLQDAVRQRLPEKEMAALVGVNPFFIREYLVSLRRFDRATLRRGFETLLAADAELKGGSARDERLVLALALGRLRERPAQAQRARNEAVSPFV
ncbi:MAG TPA: DNA polymerase III subunit delta [Rubricoccaceae bacterium]|nr:DNA polymerase III subunit delta [Rubricoccaceae bacterium]